MLAFRGDAPGDGSQEGDVACVHEGPTEVLAQVAMHYWSPYRSTFHVCARAEAPPGEPAIDATRFYAKPMCDFRAQARLFSGFDFNLVWRVDDCELESSERAIASPAPGVVPLLVKAAGPQVWPAPPRQRRRGSRRGARPRESAPALCDEGPDWDEVGAGIEEGHDELADDEVFSDEGHLGDEEVAAGVGEADEEAWGTNHG
mgnify:FL=1